MARYPGLSRKVFGWIVPLFRRAIDERNYALLGALIGGFGAAIVFSIFYLIVRGDDDAANFYILMFLVVATPVAIIVGALMGAIVKQLMLLAFGSSAPRGTRVTDKQAKKPDFKPNFGKASRDDQSGYYYDEAGNLIKYIPPQSDDEDF